MIVDSRNKCFVDCFFKKVTRNEIKVNHFNANGNWKFDWVKPITQQFEIFGLVTNDGVVQGLVALKLNKDPDYMCVDIDLIESAPWNKKELNGQPNKFRKYIGVGKTLTAFACAYSLSNGLGGAVDLTSKSSKQDFYLSLGAAKVRGQKMVFDEIPGERLARKFFPGGVKWWVK